MPNVAILQTTADLAASQTAGGIASLVPTGTVFAYAGTSAPTGWLTCDGSAVSRTLYAGLFSALGTAHGQGDNSTTFNLPDYRGRFIRGGDAMFGGTAATRDPDRTSRTAAATGGNTGNAVGSVQGTQTNSHGHDFTVVTANVNDPPSAPYQLLFSSGNVGSANSSVANVNATGMQVRGYDNGAVAANARFVNVKASTGTEDRPINAYVNYIIKI